MIHSLTGPAPPPPQTFERKTRAKKHPPLPSSLPPSHGSFHRCSRPSSVGDFKAPKNPNVHMGNLGYNNFNCQQVSTPIFCRIAVDIALLLVNNMPSFPRIMSSNAPCSLLAPFGFITTNHLLLLLLLLPPLPVEPTLSFSSISLLHYGEGRRVEPSLALRNGYLTRPPAQPATRQTGRLPEGRGRRRD